MNHQSSSTLKRFLSLLVVATILFAFTQQDYKVDESRFVIHKVDPSKRELRLYWKDSKGKIYGSLANLKKSLSNDKETLVFAMNGGMYNKDQSPQGLFVENGSILGQLDTNKTGFGNFYMQPNGIFSITSDNKAAVTQTKDFILHPAVKYATQSGPMLLIDGSYHPRLIKGSTNLHIRNGVGILPNGEIMFAMSKERVNFYDLATLFHQNGCKNALYLDGFVSRTYLPASDWTQLDGNFGVIIGETK